MTISGKLNFYKHFLRKNLLIGVLTEEGRTMKHMSHSSVPFAVFFGGYKQ